jgi:O-antigen ligase
MTASGETARDAPGPGLFLAAWTAFGLAALAAAVLVGFGDYPVALLAALPIAAGLGVVCVWNTHFGLCLAAFSIGPLNIAQVEIAGVTVTLPEVLILALVAKETLRFALLDTAPADFVPWKTLGLYLLASLTGVATGLLYGNGLVHTLQDFRQFTEFVLLYLLIVHRVRSRREIFQILWCFVLGLSVLAGHAVLQRFTGHGLPGMQRLSDAVLYGDFRSGSFYGPTPLGALMVLCLGPAIGLLLGMRRRWARAVLAGLVALAVVAAVFTYTRASWLAIGLLLAFVFLSVRKPPRVIVMAAAAAMLFAALLGPVVVQRLGQLQVSKAEQSLRHRVQYYTVAWHIARAHPVLGLGWGRFYENSRILVNRRYVPTPQYKRPERFSAEVSTVHSAYLQILVKTGLFGLLTFLIFLGTWFAGVARERWARPRDELDHNLFVGTAAGLIGYLFHATFENFFQWPVMAQSFWLLLGLSTVMAARIARTGHIGPAPRGGTAARETVS